MFQPARDPGSYVKNKNGKVWIGIPAGAGSAEARELDPAEARKLGQEILAAAERAEQESPVVITMLRDLEDAGYDDADEVPLIDVAVALIRRGWQKGEGET